MQNPAREKYTIQVPERRTIYIFGTKAYSDKGTAHEAPVILTRESKLSMKKNK